MAEKRGRRRQRSDQPAPSSLERSGSSADTFVAPEERTLIVNKEQVAKEGRPAMKADETSSASTEETWAEAGAAVRDSLVGSLKGIQEIETAAIGVIERAAGETFKAARTVAVDGMGAIKDVTNGALQALTDVGSGLMGGARRLSTDFMAGVSDVGGEVLTTVHRAARGMVSGAAELGADVGTVARNTTLGTVGVAQEVGGNIGGLLKTAASGTVDTIQMIGTEAIKTASTILVTAVQGVKDVLNAALPRR
ncbi:MAG TPA: hypothetical protein VNN62_05560 [Methylomirabilota bacterium]|jgi:hypothetical protein|nr:hypothetical protein [Methylomirabilota bacterium]